MSPHSICLRIQLYVKFCDIRVFVRHSIAEIARTRMRPEMRSRVQLTVCSLNLSAELFYGLLIKVYPTTLDLLLNCFELNSSAAFN